MLTPWNPATTATLPAASASRTRSPLTSTILALPWAVSVMMPTWLPVKLTAATPRSARAIVSSAAETRSPVVSSMSISRPGRVVDTCAGEGDEVVGGLAHRRHDDDDVVAVALGEGHVLGHGPHAVRVGDGGAAVLLDDQGHGRRSLPGFGRPESSVRPAASGASAVLVTCCTTSKPSRWAPVDTGLPSDDSARAWPCWNAWLLHPRLERLLAVPAGVDEVTLLALDGAQQLEVLEAGHLLDAAGAGGEALLQLGSGARRARRWH